MLGHLCPRSRTIPSYPQLQPQWQYFCPGFVAVSTQGFCFLFLVKTTVLVAVSTIQILIFKEGLIYSLWTRSPYRAEWNWIKSLLWWLKSIPFLGKWNQSQLMHGICCFTNWEPWWLYTGGHQLYHPLDALEFHSSPETACVFWTFIFKMPAWGNAHGPLGNLTVPADSAASWLSYCPRTLTTPQGFYF